MMLLSDFLQGKMMRQDNDLGFTVAERGPAQNHPIRQPPGGANWEQRRADRRAAHDHGAAFSNKQRDEWEAAHFMEEEMEDLEYHQMMKEWNDRTWRSNENSNNQKWQKQKQG